MFTDVAGTPDAVDLISSAMPIIFGIVLLVFVVLGLILAYHWRKYSYNVGAAFLFQVFYWGIGGLFIAAMGTAIITFRS